MGIQYIGLQEINGPLVVLDDVENVHYEEMVELRLSDQDRRLGRVVQLAGKRAVIQVFEGTNGISLTNTTTKIGRAHV